MAAQSNTKSQVNTSKKLGDKNNYGVRFIRGCGNTSCTIV